MTNIEKCLLGAGAIVSTLLVFEVASILRPDHSTPQEGSAQNAPKPALSQSTLQSPAVQPVPIAISAAPVVKTNASVPVNATSIPDSSLLNLSTMVNLAEARDHMPDKTQWTQAISSAQALLQGPCDCEQRNWLNHFIEMGNYALSNSNEYFKSAELMATMPRNDSAAMALSRRSN